MLNLKDHNSVICFAKFFMSKMTVEAEGSSAFLNQINELVELFQNKNIFLLFQTSLRQKNSLTEFWQAVEQKFTANYFVIKFFKFVIFQKKHYLLPFIFQEIKKNLQDQAGIIDCKFYSSHPLSLELQEQMVEVFSKKFNKKLNPKFYQKKSLILGLRVQTAKEVWEKSFAMQLKKVNFSEVLHEK